MASLFQVFDSDEVLSEGTQLRRHVAGGSVSQLKGFEAPRNSLDESSSFEISSHKPEDIPCGYEFCNPAFDGQWKGDGREEKKTRAPNVVARLMGLDAMPDDRPTRTSSQEKPKYGRNGGNAPVVKARAPVREHPQEAELQRFKKEFEAKQQLDGMNRQLEEKKRKVRATLDKARLALSQGIIADPKHGKFEESKEFLEALEFLQCNKDFIFQFLQQKPHAVFSNSESFNSPTTTPVMTHWKKGKQATQGPTRDSNERRFSPRVLARLFMSSDSRKRNDHSNPTARHRPGSRDLTSEEAKRRTSSSTSSRYMLPSSPKPQIKHEGRGANKKKGARDVIVEIKERLRRREQQSGEQVQCTKALIKHEQSQDSKAREAKSSQNPSNFTLTKSLSTGKRISMMRPDIDDMSDGEEISTPKAVLAAHPTDSSATFQVNTRKKKTNCLHSGSSQCEGVKNPPNMKPMHRSAETATPSNGKLDSPGKKLLHTVNDPASSSNFTRCRSVPSVALLRERGPYTTGIDIAKNGTAPKVPKPARSPQNGDQRTLGFFSKGSRAGREAPEAVPALPSPSRDAAMAEPSVLQRNEACRNGKDANPREAKVRRNILSCAKDDLDSYGQLSPVSVSGTAESSPGPPEFNIANDLQDPLRIRLRRPKLDRSSLRVRDNELDAARVRHCDARSRGEVPHRPTSRTSSTHITAERPLHAPPGHASDFAFVCDVLVASGFHTHGGRNITRWHSATQPISPRLMENVEGGGGGSCRSSHQRILFDAINEVLIARLELGSVISPAQCDGLPIVGVPNSAVSGRRFVEDVWGEIQKRRFPVARCQDSYLHSLVAQELRTTSAWMSLRRDVDHICLQLEKAIWNDLVEDELCAGLLSL